MLRGLVLAALLPSAVAGGNLGVTAAPSRPFAGQRVAVYATGQVDTRGRLYVFRNLDRRCAVSERGERGLGRRARALHAPVKVEGAFEFRTGYVPRRPGRREWVCSYLYSIVCEAGGLNCAPELGLPPDAGYFENRVSVRARPGPARGSPARR